jgi:hypothetical protein
MGCLTKPLRLVCVSGLLLLAVWASGSQAQFLSQQVAESDGERLLTNPSPRLAGMGLLKIAVEDENNELNLFDYVGSVAGLLSDRDSTSVDFLFDLARRHTDWTGIDPWLLSPTGRLYPNFLEFGRADYKDGFGFERYDLLSVYRRPKDLSVGARVRRVKSFIEQDVTKYDATYIRAIGEADNLQPDTVWAPKIERDSLARVEQWVFDMMADKQLSEGVVVGGHAIFSFENQEPAIYHKPDSLVDAITKVTAVDTLVVPAQAFVRYPYPMPRGGGRGVGGGIAFSYDWNDMVTLGAAGDIFSFNDQYNLKGRFFRQEITQDRFSKSGKLHTLLKFGNVLEGAVKHQSSSGDGSGTYFWSYGCPVQGGGFQTTTVRGPTADTKFWEERTGTRWLLRVPDTSIKLSMEYEDARGSNTVRPDSAYNSAVFDVPGDCAFGDLAVEHPKLAFVIDNAPIDYSFDERTFTTGASLTLWFGRRPLSLATEYESWSQEWEEATDGPGTRDLSLVKLGSEVSVTRSITLRVGGVWGQDRLTQSSGAPLVQYPLAGTWTEKNLTIGGTYVLLPGLRQIEVAYLYRTRKPDFPDVYSREVKEHRLTAYTRFYF